MRGGGPGQPRYKCHDPTQKTAKAKRSGGVAQVVECLPRKCKIPELEPQNHKKRKGAI
jgi:hypothetical protein